METRAISFSDLGFSLMALTRDRKSWSARASDDTTGDDDDDDEDDDDEDDDDEDKRRLSAHVQKMPDVTVGGADVGSRCGVCIEDFEMGERGVIKLACSHLLHRECLQQWVNRDNRSCPICRQDVATESASSNG